MATFVTNSGSALVTTVGATVSFSATGVASAKSRAKSAFVPSAYAALAHRGVAVAPDARRARIAARRRTR